MAAANNGAGVFPRYATAIPVTGPGEVPPAAPNILGGRNRVNSTTSTVTLNGNNGSPRGAGAAAAAAPMPEGTPSTPAERCARARTDLAAVSSASTNTNTNTNTTANAMSVVGTPVERPAPTVPGPLNTSLPESAAVRIQREIDNLELQAAAACNKCDEARAQIAALRQELTGVPRPAPTAANLRYGRKGPSGVAPACNALPNPVKFFIYFTRHSESCANVMKRNITFGGFRQKGYTDPELSDRGVAMATERAGQLAGVLTTELNSERVLMDNKTPWIVCASALFRAQQTAMILSDGIPTQRASDRVVVLPYIQETGIGDENTAFAAADRERLGLYAKLPGGAASRDRIVTTLFDNVTGGSTPDVSEFFKWLGCNADGIYKVAGAGIYPTLTEESDVLGIRLLVVTHTGLMADMYKKITGSSPPQKYENLDGMEVTVSYDRFGKQTAAPQILTQMLRYTASIAVPHSCPAPGCRFPVCPDGATASAPAIRAGDPRVCGVLPALQTYAATRGAQPITAANYAAQVKPLVSVLGTNSRSQIKELRKALAEYDPPGAFMSVFKKAKPAAGLGAIADRVGSFVQCPEEPLDNLRFYEAGAGARTGGARRKTRRHRRRSHHKKSRARKTAKK